MTATGPHGPSLRENLLVGEGRESCLALTSLLCLAGQGCWNNGPFISNPDVLAHGEWGEAGTWTEFTKPSLKEWVHTTLGTLGSQKPRKGGSCLEEAEPGQVPLPKVPGAKGKWTETGEDNPQFL